MSDTIQDILGLDKRVFIVAEIGKNFIQTKEDRRSEEYLENAKELVNAAYSVGADAVKFQTHNVEDEQLAAEIKSPHFDGSSRYSWVKRNTNATPLSFWKDLKKYCDALGIIFFSTPMSRGAAQLLEEIGVPLWKIASSDILDFVMLDYVAATGKPIIISSGMSTEAELDRCVAFLKKRTDNIMIMHCVSKYPCPREDLRLDTIQYLSDKYGVPIGFSDHSLEWEAPAAAVNKGARVIEKHFSLSRDLWGSDHKVSMSPEEFKKMIHAIRAREEIDPKQFGKGIKSLDEEESAFRPIFRKSLMAGRDIPAGIVITSEMLYAMRPQKHAKGLPSEEYENVLGKITTKNFKKYDPITAESISQAI